MERALPCLQVSESKRNGEFTGIWGFNNEISSFKTCSEQDSWFHYSEYVWPKSSAGYQTSIPLCCVAAAVARRVVEQGWRWDGDRWQGRNHHTLADVGAPGLAERAVSGALRCLAEDGWDCSKTKLSIQDVPERHCQGATGVWNRLVLQPVGNAGEMSIQCRNHVCSTCALRG